MVTKALEMMNLPTKDDIERLEQKVQTLTTRLERLEGTRTVDSQEV
jgi:ubiquinone biosynthesis protein UbiJ